MKEQPVVPVYNMSQGVLAQLGDKAVNLATRDTAELTSYGVNMGYIADLQAKVTAVKEYPTDEEVLGDQKDLGETGKAAAEKVRVNIMSRVRHVFPEGSGKYNSFGTKGMDQMNNPDLAKCGYRVVRMATKHLQLIGQGLTQDMIDDMKTEIQAFDNAYDAHQDSILERDSATRERTMLSNTLYLKCVELFDYGKDYWASRDQSEYNDYIIYNTPSGLPPVAGEYGAVHGTMLNSTTQQPVANGLVFLAGIQEPIEADEEGNWECEQVHISCTQISATADNCLDYNATITIIPGDDIAFDILMEPEV
jgi:hypothetical protein